MDNNYSEIQVPQKEIADHGLTALRSALSAIPIAGGPVVELLAAIVTPPIEKRRNQWMEAVSVALHKLQQQRNIDLASLTNNPQFVDAVLEASRIALRTSRSEKLDALRNVVLNSALQTEPDITIQEILLNLVDLLTPLHIRFLQNFAGKGCCTTSSPTGFTWNIPELEGSPLLYRMIWKDLHDRDLIESDAPVPTAEKHTISLKVSDLGLRLFRFISDPP